jgi:hypothetical protein
MHGATVKNNPVCSKKNLPNGDPCNHQFNASKSNANFRETITISICKQHCHTRKKRYKVQKPDDTVVKINREVRDILLCGATQPRAQGPPHYRGYTITTTHTLGGTP